MKKQTARCLLCITVTVLSVALSNDAVHGQAFGVALQANLNPAAGGMGGTAIARPQDVQSALGINPAKLPLLPWIITPGALPP